MLRGIKTQMLNMTSRINEYSYFLVAVQLGSIAFLTVTTPYSDLKSPFVFPFLFSSGILLLWSMYSVNIKSWHILPRVRKSAELAFRGPYKTIRHPMYLSILVFTTPLLFAQFSALRLTTLLALVIVLLLKIELEEKLLKERFPGYQNYSLRTYRIIPYIY